MIILIIEWSLLFWWRSYREGLFVFIDKIVLMMPRKNSPNVWEIFGYLKRVEWRWNKVVVALWGGYCNGKPFKMAWECKTNGWWPTLVLVNVVLWYCWICPFKKRWRDKKDMVEDYLEGWGVPRETHILSYFKP